MTLHVLILVILDVYQMATVFAKNGYVMDVKIVQMAQMKEKIVSDNVHCHIIEYDSILY